MHLQKCEEEKKERNTRARSLALSGQAGRGEARRWAWVHDMCMNCPPKSRPKPRRSMTYFCCLFLL
jgi:hypothetical protein